MRIYVFSLLVILFAGCQSGKDQASVKKLTEIVSPYYQETDKPFYHGVASGDPLADRVIIWTRVTPENSVSEIKTKWEIADNEEFEPVLKKGTLTTSPEHDYTVKVDVGGLQPNRSYYYRFMALDKISPVGRTKTLPQGRVDSLKFAVVSCSNWQHGYFNAYERIAEKSVDVVLHLGDYIYEAGADRAKIAGRTHLPEHEIVTLADYRIRYSQYHLDEGLKKMRQRHPIITIWDDHEVANNTYIDGAQNHQPETEGDYIARVAAAKKAYYEWIPIRDGEKHYRAFNFGNLADLIMLDERLEGRTKPATGIDDPFYELEDRSMLGEEQLKWFESRLRNNSSAWKVIGNQVMFSDLYRSVRNQKSPRNMDSWDGYPAEKKRVAEVIKQHDVKNIIFLTGDTHSSWAFEVVADALKGKATANYEPLAVEFGTTSVSSSNSNESNPDEEVKIMEQNYMEANPHLKYVNRRDHGYLMLTLYKEDARADWYFVGTILNPDASEELARTFHVNLNSNTLRSR
jgi:alkaline phosphatase D